MPTPVESAHLILKLFELRREPTLREARAWFLTDFNPETMDELVAVASGDKNAWFRMVLGYWEMAASLVTYGAIDAAMFRAANTEIIATFAKVEPFVEQLRGTGEYLKHLERVVRETPVSKEYLATAREQFRAVALARKASSPSVSA